MSDLTCSDPDCTKPGVYAFSAGHDRRVYFCHPDAHPEIYQEAIEARSRFEDELRAAASARGEFWPQGDPTEAAVDDRHQRTQDRLERHRLENERRIYGSAGK